MLQGLVSPRPAGTGLLISLEWLALPPLCPGSSTTSAAGAVGDGAAAVEDGAAEEAGAGIADPATGDTPPEHAANSTDPASNPVHERHRMAHTVAHSHGRPPPNHRRVTLRDPATTALTGAAARG
ncbi:hypothetical protein GCM10017788_49550 [Amycolatopsis acidiphila]|nr:hypothetical protein GCM10017788_49550 [Amycolatopsis acidiphila]